MMRESDTRLPPAYFESQYDEPQVFFIYFFFLSLHLVVSRGSGLLKNVAGPINRESRPRSSWAKKKRIKRRRKMMVGRDGFQSQQTVPSDVSVPL